MDYYQHKNHLVRFDGKCWKDVNFCTEPELKHHEISTRFRAWIEKQEDDLEFVFLCSYDLSQEEDLRAAVRLIESFGKNSSQGDTHKNNGNRLKSEQKDLIRKCKLAGRTNASIAAQFKVSVRTVQRI